MQTLLTIAIPTYNRSETLDKALFYLLPQIIGLQSNIEIIISDNCSSDNSKDIIQKWTNQYNNFNFKVNYQIENTGFYGNFKKCKELATGKYIWILSDDDHLVSDSLAIIIDILTKESPDLLFLENSHLANNIQNTSFEELVFLKNYRLTLISSVIFRQELSDDNIVFRKFNRSSFISFALIISMRSKAKYTTISQKKVFNERKAKPGGYNFYKVFVIELGQILKYMLQIGYSSACVNKIKNQILTKLIVKRYLYQKLFGRLDGSLQTFPIPQINKLIYRYYRKSSLYWVLFVPLKLIPSLNIKSTKKY